MGQESGILKSRMFGAKDIFLTASVASGSLSGNTQFISQKLFTQTKIHMIYTIE